MCYLFSVLKILWNYDESLFIVSYSSGGFNTYYNTTIDNMIKNASLEYPFIDKAPNIII